MCPKCGWPADDCHCAGSLEPPGEPVPARITARLHVANTSSGKRVTVIDGLPKNPANEAMVSMHYKQFKSPPDFFTAGGFSAAMAVVSALKKTNGDSGADKLIPAMEGMSFDTPKGKMTFRKEDHQAMQSMYHFKIKVDPAFAWGVPELVREIKPEEMDVPIKNKR